VNSKLAREVAAAWEACVAPVEGAPSFGDAADWVGSVRGGERPVLILRPRDGKAGKTRPFSPTAFDEPIATALKDFQALAPVASVRVAPGGAWTMILKRPLAWPLFLRCDVAASFAPRAAQLSLVLRDARVVALDFDGEALWARFTD
jgi:hypothetical protein